jgi:DNA polymerase III delta' subunit
MTSRALRTRGQPIALAAVEAMLASHVPHALLLVGPGGVGKTTLANDLARGLLCRAPDPASRPCGECRACRSVDHGNHPDLHRLAPSGAGGVIPIGGRDERGVRDLIGELALMPVEAGYRVAIVEAAHRMSDDAQSAFLKTLEEPPTGSVLILCADDEERLLPTIRSRCVRIRLGPVPRRDIASIVVERGLGDAAEAAKVARIAGGRPGRALSYAAAPDAVIARAEIARGLLDLDGSSRTVRLLALRDLATRASALVKALEAGSARVGAAEGIAQVESGASGASGTGSQASLSRRGRRSKGLSTPEDGAPLPAGAASPVEIDVADPETPAASRAVRVPASERRAAALALVGVWRDVLRDLAAIEAGEPRLVRDIDLLDDLERVAEGRDLTTVGEALRRLDVAGERIEGNVSPELVLDVLALQHAW